MLDFAQALVIFEANRALRKTVTEYENAIEVEFEVDYQRSPFLDGFSRALAPSN